MLDMMSTVAPSARILVRDAEWVVRRVDPTSTGVQAITAFCISELVGGEEAFFLSEVEDTFRSGIQILKPDATILTVNRSSQLRQTKLYSDSGFGIRFIPIGAGDKKSTFKQSREIFSHGNSGTL